MSSSEKSFRSPSCAAKKIECSCCKTESIILSEQAGKGVYAYCKHCRIFFFKREGGVPSFISNDYFDDEYKEQYGRTYLEDFNHIRLMGEARLKHIHAIQNQRKVEKAYLLDIGCAYGPFLAAAKDAGFIPFGQDLFKPALEWVHLNLGVGVAEGDFLSPLFPPANNSGSSSEEVTWPKKFDVITLWYVIEHFENPAEVLIKINRMLKDGGILAFSTPSGEGISARKNLPLFLERSPSDHYTIWKPLLQKHFLNDMALSWKKK